MEKHSFTINLASLLLIILCLSVSEIGYSQTPAATEIFQKMKEKIRSIRTISYNIQQSQVYSGMDDSVYSASSTTWVERVPSDTIYGSHFHIRQTNKSGEADYYYDGKTGIDIYHRHKFAEHEKTITVQEPFRMAGGLNAVQTLVTAVMGYSKELLALQLNPAWTRYLDSMKVQEKGQHWVIEWNESVPAGDFYAQHRVYIDKTNNLIHRIERQSTWRGAPARQETTISNVRINHPEDKDSVRLNKLFPDYKVKYVNRKTYFNEEATTLSLLIGTKAKDFTYTSFSGEQVSTYPKKGKLLLLDFWETWCGGCFLAMPKLKKLYEQYKSKGLEMVALVTENKEQVKKILASQNFPYPTVYADERIKQFYSLNSRPRYILLDGTGTILADTSGDLDQVTTVIERMLK